MPHIDIVARIAAWKVATPQMSGETKTHLRQMLDKLIPLLERDVREIARHNAVELPGGRDFWESFAEHGKEVLAGCRDLREALF